ncbi:putative holin-like toxin [Staphylococcus pseudintermedius]|nr:putative holin-like toxin [Staphylococcus pseudintermedius]EJG0136279.1 putative holin-like toxin [Staphylococcus pseudintermedius]ELH8585899.1 putative holin-like toxin [Staphylococcus pseudintermedius]ELW0044491.1 putative holin-like toxin [Staphylococcus pseudintermedius]MDK3738011.1 putative holin-like toxin [Staphylococcus pseudintermedius]
MISIADALMIMLGFGTFTVALIHLVVSIDKKSKKTITSFGECDGYLIIK